MRIAQLELTGHPSPLLDGLPRTAQQIKAWLAPHLPEVTFTATNIVDGAPLPEYRDFDGVIVGGSEFGIYDDTPWMQPLRQFLTGCRDRQKPIFGICFGHQIMADVFGGRAEKASVGNIVGARPFRYHGDPVEAYVWHQDQVTQVPGGARVTASASHCPVGALDYDFAARSVQFHPEYRADHLTTLFSRGRDIFLPADLAEAGLDSLKSAHVLDDLAAAQAAQLFRGQYLPG